MKKNEDLFSESELNKACIYVQQQFGAKSWWPMAQPGLAKQEFQLMKGNAESFNIWCERWLDKGQRQKLMNALKRAI